MSAISLTRLYELLVPKLGKEATECLITFNENKTKSEVENACKYLATKDDISIIKDSICSIKETIALIKGDLGSINQKLDGFDEKIDAKVNRSQMETIRWMFAFWVTQLAATFGFILLFMKK
jgi:uncharacterized Zn ribbon protein